MTARRPELPRGAVTAASGVLIVDKPAELTSHDVVARTRRLAATKKVGHAGTLDPMATGVLVLGVGRATRLLTFVVGADKEYIATIRLGQRTLTDDAEGEVTGSPGAAALLPDGQEVDLARIEEAMTGLRGPIAQVPSAVSAIKIDGRRSYARVRSGEEVALEPRPVTVRRFEVTGEPRPATAADPASAEVPVVDLDVVVACSSGTYVRALARDLGEALGTGGHLTALRRTRVGPFGLDRARTLEDLAAAVAADAEQPEPAGLPVASLTEAAITLFPVRRLEEREAASLRYGKPLAPTGREDVVAALDPEGDVVALLRDETRGRDVLARPVLVLAPA